jgi:Gpi18-like mannosyltransferase
MFKKEELRFVLASFVVWRVVLFLFLFLSLKLFPLQKNFLGGGMQNYLNAPWLWAWSNFDGEHYLAIAQRGYGFAEQAFFPIFPLMIRFLGKFGGGSLFSLNIAGILVANSAFFLGLIGLYKLIKLDYSEKISRLVIILLLLFPTSFYFGTVYTESIFFVFFVWSLYFARSRKWFLASAIGMFVSVTRTIGIVIFPILLFEYLVTYRPRKSYSYFWIFLVPFGLFAYMFYLHQTTGDWLKFLHTLTAYGEQRSSTPILLPQVFYRYFFKVLPNTDYGYFPIVFTTLLEILTAITFTILSFWSLFKLRLSYIFYLIAGFILPTLSGSFSSLPRYVLVLFPGFLLVSLYISRLRKPIRFVIYSLLFVSLAISETLFIRGYWVS